MHKKIVVLIMSVVMGAGLIWAAEPAAKASVMPFYLNVAFFTASFQPIYTKTASVVGAPMEANKWGHFECAINKANLDYVGTGGSLKDFTAFRIQTKTKKVNQVVEIYIDNIKMADAAGAAVYDVNFEDGNNHGFFMSAGAPLPNMGKVVDFDGQKCFLLTAYTKNIYNNVQAEVSWNIADLVGDPAVKTVDLTDGAHVVSFDYYIKVTE